MSDAIRDQNFITSILCYNETTGLVEPARIDPATGALLIHITIEASNSPTSIENAKRDQNDVPSGLGYNETTGLTECLRTTTSNNLIVNFAHKIMANEQALRDNNHVPALLAITDDSAEETRMLRIDDATKGILVSAVGGSIGTVTSFSFTNANGISGVVTNPTSTPDLTLSLGAITPSAVQISGLTASEIVGTDASKNLVSLAVATYPSLTELSYVKGVTSAIQTQINTKSPSTAPTFATSITGSYLTASEILITDGSKNIVSGAVATYPSLTELSYVKGATSNLQSQINALDSVVILKGLWDASAGTFPGGGVAQAGWSYIVSVAGTVDGVAFAINDRIVAIANNASTTVYAANWFKLDYTDQVLSVFTRTGAVVATDGDYSQSLITGLKTSDSPTFAGLALGSGSLTLTGSIAATGSRVTKGWFTDIESTNMPTVGGTSIASTFAPIASPTFTGTVTIPAGAINGQMNLDGTPSADHTANGTVTTTFNLGATIALMDLVYLGASSKWLLTDADAIATASGTLGICLDAGDDTDTTTVALHGSFVRDDTWNWTPGVVTYMGETPGSISASIPTGADAVIRVIGFAVTADVIHFLPSSDVQTTVA